ncbi:MAG: hypothetical protein ACI4TX_04775 [Christensenellales bacterium]
MKEYTKLQKAFVLLIVALFVATLIYGIIDSILNTKFIYIIQSFIGIALAILPFFIEKLFKIKISFIVYVVYSFAIILTILLGFIFKFYELLPFWDIVTHSISCLLLMWMGTIIASKIISKDINNRTLIIILCGLLFALACGFIWEMIEYGTDEIFGTNMQKFIPEIESLYNGGNSHAQLNGTNEQIAEFFRQPNGYKWALQDTMQDFIWDTLGALFGLMLFSLLSKNYKSKFCNSITSLQH